MQQTVGFNLMKFQTLIMVLIVLSMTHLMAEMNFSELKKIELTTTSLPMVNAEGLLKDHENQHKMCQKWVLDAIKGGNHATITTELVAGFEKTGFGQIVLKEMLAYQKMDAVQIPVLAHMLSLMMNHPDDSLMLARPRYFLDSGSAKRAICVRMERLIQVGDELSLITDVDSKIIERLVAGIEQAMQKASPEDKVFLESGLLSLRKIKIGK